MDKIKDTLHLKYKQEPTSTSGFTNTNETQTGHSPRYHGSEYKGTSSAEVPGYGSPRGKDESIDSPGLIDKVKEALHLKKDNHDPSESNTRSSYTDFNGRDESKYLSKPSYVGNSTYPFTSQSGHTGPQTGTSQASHAGHDSDTGYYTSHMTPGTGYHSSKSSAGYNTHVTPGTGYHSSKSCASYKTHAIPGTDYNTHAIPGAGYHSSKSSTGYNTHAKSR